MACSRPLRPTTFTRIVSAQLLDDLRSGSEFGMLRTHNLSGCALVAREAGTCENPGIGLAPRGRQMNRWWQAQTAQTKLAVLAVLVTALALPPAYLGVFGRASAAPTAQPDLPSAPNADGTLRGSSTPTPAEPAVAPGTVLYQADWSAGLGGWVGSGDWHWLNGMVANDGTHSDNYNDDNITLTAPYRVDATADYAVEMQVQFVRWKGGMIGPGPESGSAIGLVARGTKAGSYVAGYSSAWGGTQWDSPTSFLAMNAHNVQVMDTLPFTPGDAWHTIRLELKGNTVKVLIDGGLVIQEVDNTYLTGGVIGIFDRGCQVDIRAFTVSAL